MKYSAEDILHQTFEKSWRGYDPGQVSEFLQAMAREWDYMTGEIVRLQDEVEQRTDEVREYRRRERGLLDALSTAREVADDIAAQAEARAAHIVEEAELRADEIVAAAEKQQEKLRRDIQSLDRQRYSLVRDLQSVLDAHARALDEYEPVDASLTAPLTEEGDEDDGTHPTIHRKPRTQPPAAPVDDEDILAEEGVDDASSETLMGVMNAE